MAPGASSESESEVEDTAVDEGEEDLEEALDDRGGVCLGVNVGLGCTRVGVIGAEGGVGVAKAGFVSSFDVVDLSSAFAVPEGFASGVAAATPNALVPA